jgi:hypothetical protein
MNDIPLVSRSGRTEKLMDFKYQESLLSEANSCAAIRKLREAVYSSHRRDAFTVQVYEKSVEIAFQERNISELFKSVALLVALYQELGIQGKSELYVYHLLLLMTHNVPMMEWIQVYQSTPSDMATRALDWYRCKRMNDFRSMSKLWKESDEKEKCILESWISDIRRGIGRSLVKAYRSLPLPILTEWLMIEEDTELSAILGLEIQPNDLSVSFRRK